MGTLLTSALLLTAGALTPGPNNLLMLRIGLERGTRAALLPAGGVVLGGVVMLLTAAAGTAPLLAAHPGMRSALLSGGALFVAWLGVRLISSAGGAPASQVPPRQRTSALSMLLLQFINPKSWVLVLTLTAAAAGGAGAPSLGALTLLFVVIPFGCLVLWAAAGALAARVLQQRRARAWFERATGLALVLCGLLLATE